jgi:hypothetical protein
MDKFLGGLLIAINVMTIAAVVLTGCDPAPQPDAEPRPEQVTCVGIEDSGARLCE